MSRLITIPALIFIVVLCRSTQASSLLYNFVERDTGDVLAVLDLASLPATHTDVNGLTFIPAGEAIFGVPGMYPGLFDTTHPSDMSFVDDGSAGLVCKNCDHLPHGSIIVDTNPPVLGWSELALSAGAQPQSGDSVVALSPIGMPTALVFGDWRLVPEPSTIMLSLLGTCAACLCRRRIRN